MRIRKIELSKENGFSMIELLIIIGVVGLIFAWAIPSYKNYLIVAHIKSASMMTLRNVQFMGKHYAICGGYIAEIKPDAKTIGCFNVDSLDKNAVWPNLPYVNYPESGTKLYQIKFASTKPSAIAFRLIATPICGTLVENSGCICIDQDSNIVPYSDSYCNNKTSLCPCATTDNF